MRKALPIVTAMLGCCFLHALGAAQSLGDTRTLLVEAVRPGVTVTVEKGCGATYYYDETVNVTVRSQLAGYLVLYDFAADGTVQQIFPNAYCPDNFIRGGGEAYTIPGNLLPFVFRVAPPEGTEVLFAVVTSGPCELVPDDAVDSRSPLPLITQSTEATVLGIVQALDALAAGTHVAAGVCQFTVAPAPAPAEGVSPPLAPAVNQSPTAAFAWRGPESATPQAGEAVQFDASGSADPDGSIVRFAWDWESDGVLDSTGASAVASHVFSTGGSYQVTLRVTDDDGATATAVQVVAVAAAPPPPPVNRAPVAAFSWSGSQGSAPRAGDTVQFDAGASTDSDGRITAYAWDWTSNGVLDSTGASAVASHVFSTGGSYQVTLRVTDDDGATATAVQVVAVAAAPPPPPVNRAPVAAFSWSGSQGSAPRAGDTVQFDARASTDSDGRITAYAWDWTSDGTYDSTGASAVASHVFSTGGSYQVTLRVTDDDGATATAMQTVPVAAVQEGKVYALYVVIGDYIGTDNDLGAGGQAALGRIRLVLGDWVDHQRTLSDSAATRSAIMDSISTFLGQAGSSDTVLFYFDGHGASLPDRDGDEADGMDEAIAPYDATDASGLIVDDQLWAALTGLKAKQAVLLFESCNSGTMDRTISGDVSAAGQYVYDGTSFLFDELYGDSSRAGNGPALLSISACGARETSVIVGLKDGTEISLFAYVLSVAFGTAGSDANDDGWVSWQEAFAAAAPIVTQLRRESSGEAQTPQILDRVGKPIQVVRVG